MFFDSEVCPKKTCCQRGHFSSTTGDCIQIPGSYGPRCDNISRFDVDPSLWHVSLPRVPEGGAGHTVPCTYAPFTARALRSYLDTWLTRTHRANVRFHGGDRTPASWRVRAWHRVTGAALWHPRQRHVPQARVDVKPRNIITTRTVRAGNLDAVAGSG